MTTVTRSMSDKIMQWNELQEKLAFIKQEEARLRKEIVDKLFSEASVGTNTIELGKGYKLKAVIKENTSIDTAALSSLKLPAGALDGVIVYKPSLSATGYKKMPANLQRILDTALVVKPGTPALSLVEPKKEK